jgi:hypothetical protein
VTLTTAQIVRLKIQDQPTLFDHTYMGDGTAQYFALPNRNLTTASAYIPIGATAWSGTGASFDPTGGQVQFSGTISANSAFRITYVFSTFSDDEITQFLTDGGSVNGAAIEACVALMFDATKRASWAAPDGSTFNDTQAQQHLREMYKLLKEEQSQDAVANGAIVGWGLNQGDW